MVLSEIFPATNRINKEATVKKAKNIPLLCKPKCSLKSGAMVNMVPIEKQSSKVIKAGRIADASNISVRLIFKWPALKRVALGKVSFTLYKIMTEPSAKKAET